MARILAYTPPASGHVFPLVPGLLELQRRGHRVQVRTAPSAVPHLISAGIDAAAVDPSIAADAAGGDRTGRSKDGLAAGLQAVLRSGAAEGGDLDAAIAEHRPDLLIVDAMAYGALTRAEASGLPWVMSMPSLLPLPEPGIPPYSLGLPPARTPAGRIRDAVLWPVVERAFGRALLPGLNRLRGDSGLAPFRSPLDAYTRPDRVIALTGEPIEYPRRQLPAHIRMVGFQPWDPPAAVPDWLTEPGDPWVLVTCSTDYQGDEALARVAVEALRDQPYRVLVTLADAFDGAELPPAPNVVVRRFVPHGPVLTRAVAVVTHAGMGIVGKATRAGVPIVAVPFGRDQPEIARRISQAGTGVRLPAGRLTPQRVRDAVHRAIALRPRAEQVAEDLAGTRPAAAFADTVAELLPTTTGDEPLRTRSSVS
jgi:UDP:flavonoid glycosyltransferase YjiC (YdhE family)